MGQVYLARHREVGRTEAIKVLRSQVALDERFVARFRREARATNRLQHPNIVAMHDFGRLPDGRFYLSMEYADGKSLGALMHDGPLPFARALRIIIQLAAALEHAHSRGVLHRDLKPANLMLVQHRGKEDVLKVLDFGVSKIISPDYNESIMVSQDGIVFGTPLYMAPEQFYKHPDDPRSDIYAIGCLAYELVVGEPPFIGSIPEVVRAHVEQAPAKPSDHAPLGDVDAEFDDVVLRCLEKSPAERFQSAGELLRALVLLEPTGHHDDRKVDLEATVVPDLSQYELYDVPVGGATTVIAQPFPMVVTDPGSSAVKVGQADHDEALRELAECMLDHGANDSRLTIGVADLRAIEHELSQCDEEIRALNMRESRVEQTEREREGMLRFALGELIFDRDEGAPERRQDLDYQIEALEKRLAEVMKESKAELERIADEAIGLAARRAGIEERRQEIYARLEKLVDELLPQFDDNLSVAPFIDRYLSIRELT